MQTLFVGKIAPDVQFFAHFCTVVSDKKQLTGGLTEAAFVRATVGLLSGVSAYQALCQDVCEEDERERQGKPRTEGIGHVVSCGCILMWPVLRDMDRFSGVAAHVDAAAERVRCTGGRRDGAAGSEGNDNDGGDKRSSGKRPAQQQRPTIGVKASKRMRDNKEDVQERRECSVPSQCAHGRR